MRDWEVLKEMFVKAMKINYLMMMMIKYNVAEIKNKIESVSRPRKCTCGNMYTDKKNSLLAM